MKDVLKYALIGGGAWFLFKDQISALLNSSSGTPATTATPAAGATENNAPAAAGPAAQAPAAAAPLTPQQQVQQQAAQMIQAQMQNAALQQVVKQTVAQQTAAPIMAAMTQAPIGTDPASIILQYTQAIAAAQANARNAPNPVVSDADLIAAATDPAQVARAGTTHLNGFQWNYYANAPQRAAGQPEINFASPADYLPGVGLAPDALITAAEYHAYRPAPATGLSGLPGLRAWRFQNYV